MCISFVYLHGRRVLIASNRDEVFARKTIPLSKWKLAREGEKEREMREMKEDVNVNVISGRDSERGGLWLGVSERGRWAVLTNFRDTGMKRGTLSRGEIVKAWLGGEEESAQGRESRSVRETATASSQLTQPLPACVITPSVAFAKRLEAEVAEGKHSPFSVAFGEVEGEVP